MTQKEKELLLKDLCARLPHRVKVYNTTFKEPAIQTLYGKISGDEFLMEETYTSVGVDGDDFGSFNKKHYTGYVDFIKPYLRPMSSMTEEEREEWADLFMKPICELEQYVDEKEAQDMAPVLFGKSHSISIDWLNAHHFDYRNLIEKGLALEAPEGMYKNK